MAKKIEYRTIVKQTYIFADELNQLGEEGWILCDKQDSVKRNSTGQQFNVVNYTFYREIDEDVIQEDNEDL